LPPRQGLPAAEPVKGAAGAVAGKTALAGVDELLATVTDDDYRHHLQDLFDGLADVDGLTVFWGTTGCSLRIAVPDRSPLSVGWVFPPGPPRWMGLTDLTLGWYEDASGLVITPSGRAALEQYLERLGAMAGSARPKTAMIHGWTFSPAAVVANTADLQDAVRVLAAALLQR
jgi:hypothetical protein